MYKKIAINYDRIAFWTIFGGICIAFTYLFCAFSYATDDWHFLYSIETKGTWNTLVHYFYNDNGRVGNLLSIILLNFPLAIARCLEVVGFIAGFWLMIKLSGIKPGQWKKLSLLSFLMVFGIMWQDNMFTQPFAFNYVLPIPLLAGMSYIYLYPSNRVKWYGILCGVLLGCWHDTYAFVFLCGCISVWIFTLSRPLKVRLIYFFSVFVGFLWIAINKIFWTNHLDFFEVGIPSYYIIFSIWVFILSCAIWLISLFIPSWRHIAFSPLVLFSLGGCVTIPIALFFNVQRAAMPMLVISCCALTGQIVFIYRKWRPLVKGILAFCFVVFTFSHLIGVCLETYKIIPIYNKITDTIKNTPKSQEFAFAPIRFSYDAPWITLNRPILRGLDPTGHLIHYQTYYYVNSTDEIVPEELQYYKKGLGQSVSDDSDIRLWKRNIISSNINDTVFKKAFVRYEGMSKEEFTDVRSTVFRADNGEQYVFIFPKRSVLSRYKGLPTSIKLLK